LEQGILYVIRKSQSSNQEDVPPDLLNPKTMNKYKIKVCPAVKKRLKIGDTNEYMLLFDNCQHFDEDNQYKHGYFK